MLIQMNIIFTHVFQCGLSKKKKFMKHAEGVGGKSNNLVLCIHFWCVHKLRKATISYVLSLSVCPSVLPSAHLQGTRIITRFDIWVSFVNQSRKLKFH